MISFQYHTQLEKLRPQSILACAGTVKSPTFYRPVL